MTHELRVKEREKRKHKGLLTQNETPFDFIEFVSLQGNIPLNKAKDMFGYLKKGNKSKLRYVK